MALNLLRFVPLVLLLAACVAANAQDLTTPEAALRSFASYYGAGDYMKAVGCIKDGKYNPAFDAMAADAKIHPTVMTFSNLTVKTEGEAATVTAQVSMKESRSSKPQQFATEIQLTHSGSQWLIVPRMPKVDAQHIDRIDALQAFTWALADPNTLLPTFAAAREKARAAVCLSNIKQLGLGALMLCQDYDDKFDLRPDKFVKALEPYVRDKEVFRCASDDAGATSYAFNAALAGRRQPGDKASARIVMIYEGKAGSLNFKHGGKAAVCFADGHAVMVDRTEAEKMRWKP